MSRTYLAVIDEGSGTARPATDQDVVILGASTETSTTNPITYYVSVNGSDSNPGTQARPFRTIQAAVNKVPKVIRHPVYINVGAGTFAGAHISGFSFPAAATTDGSWLYIQGTLARVVPTTGAAYGTYTSQTQGSNQVHGTLTKTGAGWTVDDFKGKFLRVVSSGVSQYRAIASNTAEVITIAGTLPSSLSTEFEIVEPSTIINEGVVRPPTSPSSTGVTRYAFMLSSMDPSYHGGVVGAVYLRYFTVDGLGGVYQYASNDIVADVFRVQYPTDSGVACFSGQAGGITVQNSVGLLGTKTFAGNYGTGKVSVIRSLIVGSAGGTGVLGGSAGASYIGTTTAVACVFEGLATAFVGESGILVLNTSRILNCTTGVRIHNPASMDWLMGTTLVSMLGGTDFVGCTTAIYVGPMARATVYGACTGSGNTTGIQATNGAEVRIKSDCNIGATTELSVDGSAFTLAAMRAASPKYCTNATIAITGTKVWGD